MPKALEKLQRLIDQLNAQSTDGTEYGLDYYSKSHQDDSGYLYRGYYLKTENLTDGTPAPGPDAWDFAEYVYGEHIGENFVTAENYLLKLLGKQSK